MMNPLCTQTVTLYRRQNNAVQRRVVTGCYYDWKLISTNAPEGQRRDTAFLLILPPGESVQPGDRIYDGIGPENVDWQTFLPSMVQGLSQATWVRPCYVGSSLHHTEAGNQ